jgi:rubrerythrin
MILEVSATTFFVGSAALLLAAAALLALRDARRRPAAPRPPRAHIYRCDQCGHVYVDARAVPISRCPSCRTLNEAIRR